MNLIEAIKAVPDHRHPRGIRHPLWLILTIILLGSCTGYWGYKPLVDFTKNHRQTLLKLFNLPEDTRFPSDSTFRNIIQSLELIVDGDNDYIVTVKKNQLTLFKTAQELVSSVVASDEHQTYERLHGRTTTRHTKVYRILPQLLPEWAGAKNIIAIARFGTRWEGKKSRRQLVEFHEEHYYLSSLDWSANQFSEAIRGHWLIENRLHWVKDVTLNEDNCIHRGGNAPANWAMVRQFLVSLARMSGTRTLPQAFRLMANQIEYLSELLFGFSSRENSVKFCT
jgi:predicted transposase YbfD/YdcC